MQQWLVGMSEMYRLLAAHRALPITLAPGMKAPPGFTNASPAPATQVIRPDGTVGPSKTSGIATKDLLLGGGIAVGLGILIYAVVS